MTDDRPAPPSSLAPLLTAPDPDARELSRRSAAWAPGFVLTTDHDRWVFRRMVVAAIAADRCQQTESALRGQLARRAAACWDDDRCLEVELLAASLSRRPGPTAAALETTRHGCEWLLSRWRPLAAALENGGSWDDAQRSLALDLLGVPRELRPAAAASPDDHRALANGQVERLERKLSGPLSALDLRDRSLAAAGTPVKTPREVAALRRQEAAYLRHYEWARRQLTPRAADAEEAPVAPEREAPTAAVTETLPSPPPPSPEPAPVEVAAAAAVPPVRLATFDAVEPRPQPRNRRERRAARALARSR